MSRTASILLALATILSAGSGNKKDDPGTPKLTAEEEAVLAHTNAERKQADLPPLKVNAKLLGAARAHAENMSKQDKLEHVLDDTTPADRVKAAGYKYERTGENIAWNAKDAKEVVAGWMDSKPHRENILNKDFAEIGVAVAKNAKGEPYWVQVFGKPPE